MRFNCLSSSRRRKAQRASQPLPPARITPKASTPAGLPSTGAPLKPTPSSTSLQKPAPTAVPNPSTPAPAVTTTVPPSSLGAPLALQATTSNPPTPQENPAFAAALKAHIDSLSPEEQQAFQSAGQITPEDLLDKIIALNSTHSENSVFRKCATRCNGFLQMLDGYLKPIAIMLGYSSGFAALVVGGIKCIIDLGMRFVTFFIKLTEMMDRLAGHLGYLTEYAEHFTHAPKVQDALCEVYGDLLKFCQGARNVFSDKEGNQRRWTSFRVFLRIMWEPFELEFDGINARFDDRVQIVIRTAGILEHRRLRSQELLKAQKKKDDERRKLLIWLSKLSKLNFDEDHDRIFKKRHPDTGNWLVESPEFKNWVDEKKSCLLWCYGNPGVGKSVLASLVLEKISNDYALDSRVGIAFVYFNYQDQNSQKSNRILATFLKQLCRKKEALPAPLVEFYNTHSQAVEIPSYAQLQTQLIELAKTFDQVFIVMDAMDESEDRRQFLPFVESLAKEEKCVMKIFVTSRRERDIVYAFTRRGFPAVEVEAKRVDKDIALFVKHQVEMRTGDQNLCVIDQDLKERIAAVLVARSNGMFLWVQYQLDHIYEQPSVQDIEEALNTLPDDMDETYMRIVRKIDKQVPSMRTLAKRVLTWVITAGRALTLEELASAVAIEEDTAGTEEMKVYKPQTVLVACANFLTYESGRVRPVHYTVQEFLIASVSITCIKKPTLLQRYQVFPEDAHGQLAQLCIQYMLFRDFESCQGGIFMNWGDSIRKGFKLIDYTTGYWDHHLRSVPAALPDSLQAALDRFFSTEETNFQISYLLRTIDEPIDDHWQSGFFSNEINVLNVCLGFGLFHIFKNSRVFDTTIRDSPKYRSALHYAAKSGSIASMHELFGMGFAVDALDNARSQPLYYAALGNQQPAVELLLEKGADVNFQGGNFGNALQAAALKSDETILRILLKKGADVNAKGGEYGHALQAAAFRGHQPIVTMLLDNGANVNAQDGFYGTALEAAAHRGHESVVRELLEKGADIIAQYGFFGNATQAAAEGGREQVLQILIEAGANPNTQVDRNHPNPLYAAALEGREGAVQTLCEMGANLNKEGGHFGTALQAAAYNGHANTVRILLDHHADANASCGNYDSAMQAAAARGHAAIVELLFSRGADVKAQGGEFGNALQAAASGGGEALVLMLLEMGADVNVQGGKWGNSLQAAAVRGLERSVSLMLEMGADINAQGGIYGTALQAAAARGHESIVRILLEKGADVKIQGGKYGTVFHAAAYGGNKPAALAILEKGADMHLQSGDYGSALAAAAIRGNVPMILMLLEMGADVNAQGGNYGTALQAAASEQHEAAVKVLLEHGADASAECGWYGTALQAAASKGKASLMTMILETGVDVNIQGGFYGNALQAAASWGNQLVVRMLLDKGADVNAQGGHYGNALQAAASWGDETLVRVFLDKGADVNALGGKFGCALQAAASRGQLPLVQMLLDKGADVNTQGGDFGNPLQKAASAGFLNIVHVLLDKGADVNAQGGKYGSALRAATLAGRDSVVKLLVEAGAREDIDKE